MKFSRKIKSSDPIIPYKSKEIVDNENNTQQEKFQKEIVLQVLQNCHWGAMKLFYSELEFIILCSKYIDIDECLIVYVGAQPGYRLKHLFVKDFFPKMQMLLYDPLDFDIEGDDQIIIKTGSNGWFSDETVSEVLKIANGRKILYITDIRLVDDDQYTAQSLIHEDLQKQQKWGIMMGAEFMLLKFRTFFYKEDPTEIDFINNTLPEEYKDKFIYEMNEKKHKSKSNYLLYLNGAMYTQIYTPQRSTECRLFIKKIKYYKDHENFTKNEQEKYKMKYYDNVKYEGIFNYFNLKKRNQKYTFRKSAKLAKYMIGENISYASASEYYIIRQYLKYKKEKPTLKNILNKIIQVHNFLNNRYSNNLIVCGFIKNMSKLKKKFPEHYNAIIDEIKILTKKNVNKINKQMTNLKNTKLIDEKTKREFIDSFTINNNPFMYRKDDVFVSKY